VVLGEVRDYYHRILPFFEEELRGRGDEDFWAWMAGEPPGCRVLELGAGTGRATRFLARKAGRVVALDLSAELTAQARRAVVPHVQLLVADMRDIHLAARFDLVVAVDDPFVHLIPDDDRERAFAAAAEHLTPDGRFVVDAAWFPPRDRNDAAEGLVREKTVDHGRLLVRQVWRCDPDTRLCSARFEYRQSGRLAAAASFRGRLWSIEELEGRARDAGLRISRLWGDYDRRHWDRKTSPRLIAEMRLRSPASSA
jgi:SAM-dependent methyltransferase